MSNEDYSDDVAILRKVLKSDIDIEKFEKISKSEYKNYDVVIFLGEDYNLFGN